MELDNEKRSIQKQSDDIKAESNQLAKQIGELMKAGKRDEAEQIKKKTADLKNSEKNLDEKFSQIEKQVFDILVTLPNLPHHSVPLGKTAEENVVVFEKNMGWGKDQKKKQNNHRYTSRRSQLLSD